MAPSRHLEIYKCVFIVNYNYVPITTKHEDMNESLFSIFDFNSVKEFKMVDSPFALKETFNPKIYTLSVKRKLYLEN